MPLLRSKTWKSDTTMSTSDSRKDAPRFPGEAFETVLPGERFGVPVGVPDPAVLARMANEFFTALPELSQAEQSAPTVPQLSAAVPGAAGALNASGNPAALTSWPTTGIPSEAELRAVPASQAPAAPPSLVAGLLPQALPEIPRGAGATSLSALPSFSFLDEIRPLFSYPIRSPLAAAPPLPAVKIPGETELRALANNFSRTATPQILDSGSYLGAPQVPAAAPQVGAVDKPVSFAFLDELRHLAPAGTLPAAEPWRVTAAVLPELNISSGPFDVQAIRRDFPIFEERVHGKPLIWLDNAATTQKPQSVIDRLSHFYTHENSNIHRAAHELAARATDAYEEARDTVAEFIGAPTADDIVFVRGTTEAINLVAHAWGGKHLQPGDEIVITHLEHHANIVPWQLISQKTGAILKWAPIDDAGNLLLSEFEELLGPRTKLVAASQVSNALGTVVPVDKIVELGHRYGARVLIDGAQSIQHMPVNVSELGADFFVFSGHKIYGPTGIGALYGTEEALTETPPWQGGGHMIADVTTERSLYQGPPTKFEAGTGNIADAVGLAEALRYVQRLGIERIAAYEHSLLEYATPRLADIPGVRLVGTADEKASVLSFVLAGHEPLEVGKALNAEGIAVRAGHHCAQPILRRYGLEATVRPSFAFYNTFEAIDVFINAVRRIAEGGTNVG